MQQRKRNREENTVKSDGALYILSLYFFWFLGRMSLVFSNGLDPAHKDSGLDLHIFRCLGLTGLTMKVQVQSNKDSG